MEGDSLFTMWLTMELEAQSSINVHNYFTAQEAIAEMPRLKPKAVLLGENPAEKEGVQQALLQIRHAMPDVQIMVLSKKRNVDEAVDLIKSGADICIFKNEQLVDVLIDRMQEA